MILYGMEYYRQWLVWASTSLWHLGYQSYRCLVPSQPRLLLSDATDIILRKTCKEQATENIKTE